MTNVQQSFAASITEVSGSLGDSEETKQTTAGGQMTETGIHTGIHNFWPKSQAQEIIKEAQLDLSPGIDHADAQAFKDILYCVLVTMKPAALFQRDNEMYIKGVEDVWHRSTGGDATNKHWCATSHDLADGTFVDQDIRIAGERQPL